MVLREAINVSSTLPSSSLLLIPRLVRVKVCVIDLPKGFGLVQVGRPIGDGLEDLQILLVIREVRRFGLMLRRSRLNEFPLLGCNLLGSPVSSIVVKA